MKSNADIFVLDEKSSELAAFAAEVFLASGISEYEERESSHYVDGIYFVGKKEAVKVHVMYGDEPELEQYRFCVSVSANQDATRHAKQIAQLLSQSGWPCFIPSAGWARKGWDGKGTVYEVQLGIQPDGSASGGSAG